jgi:hypothetical protein
MMLKLFSENIQLAITEKLGKERLIEMKKEKFFNKSIKVPEEMILYADADPNEKVIEEIISRKKSVQQLRSKKVLELFGELALS